MSSGPASQTERFPIGSIDLDRVRVLFASAGCRDLHVKELAWNHDSKRQIYLASDLSPFSLFPNVQDDDPPFPHWMTPSAKPKSKSGSRIHGALDLHWLAGDGSTERARAAKIIAYPQYPEVRLSGFLLGVRSIPSKYLREKSGEIYTNRLLFLGTRSDGVTFAKLAVGHDALRGEVRREPGYDTGKGLNRLELTPALGTAEEQLIARLRSIHEQGWVSGRRLSGTEVVACADQNAVGYTLEALLGISANGDNAPDFLGYEVKAMTVPGFDRGENKVVTVITPEPDLGVYHDDVHEFMLRWGYADTKGREDRWNFGGVYRVDRMHDRTGLTLRLRGYDPAKPSIMDAGGAVALEVADGTVAAAWSFAKLMAAWSAKHASTVYVPALAEKSDAGRRFQYGDRVTICEGADFMRVLAAFAVGNLYLDPALKATNWSASSPKIKRRNQFRIKRCHIPSLYESSKAVDVV